MAKAALGRRIRDARKGRHMNQAALAKAIGVSRDTVWRMEKDENVHTDHVLAALRRLGLDEPGLTSDVQQSPERQALARALLRAYDSSEHMASALEAIARPHLDAPESRGPETAVPLDAGASVVEQRSRARTNRRHR